MKYHEIIRENDANELAELKSQEYLLLQKWYAIIAKKPPEGSPELSAFWDDPNRGKVWFDQIRPLQQKINDIVTEIRKQARIKTSAKKANGGFDTHEILYHGTNEEFDQFDRSKSRTAAHIYTSPDKETAEQYGDHVYAVYGRQQPQAVLTAEDCDYRTLRRVYKYGGFKRRWDLSFDDLAELVIESNLYNYSSSSGLQDDVIDTCFSLKFRSVRISDAIPGGYGYSDSVIFDKPEDLQIVERLAESIEPSDDNVKLKAEALGNSLTVEFPTVDLWFAVTSAGDLHLSMIHVKNRSERNQGLGTTIMQRLIKFCDDNQIPMTLTPDKIDGAGATSIARLTKYYRRFNFGRNKNYRYSGLMIRYPVRIV